jgi:hypothetical protein
VKNYLDLNDDVYEKFVNLVALLMHLGIRDRGGARRHPDRANIFIGDLIDRPPGNVEMIPDVRMLAAWPGHPYSGPPVLFWHCWFSEAPQVISPRFVLPIHRGNWLRGD